MSEPLPQSAEAKTNVALCEESARVLAAYSRGELSVEQMRAALSRCQLTSNAPEAIPIRDNLVTLVDRFLEGELSFEQFNEAYGRTYHQDLPQWGLSWTEQEPLDEIDERLQWTTDDAPSDEDRAYGYRSRDEFREWLIKHRRLLTGTA